jgi:outer membrane protein assembly factor BamB
MTVNAIPSAVAAGDTVYVMSGYQGSAAVAISLDATGDVTDGPAVKWKFGRGTPYVPSPVLVNGRLYFTQANTNLLTCLDAASGKPLIDRERIPGASGFYASPIAAAGRLYFVDRSGTTVILKQADKLEVLATNKLDDPIDASPVAVGRQLFLRGEKYLYCIENSSK